MKQVGWLRWHAAAGAAALWCAAGVAPAQPKPEQPAGIYSCITPDGRKLTSDRPIVECNAREQRVLNSDGSVKRIHPPSYTADERAEKEAEERRALIARQAQQDAIRRDRNLKNRYPDEAAHQRAREAALDTVRVAMRSSERRLRDLARERQPLDNEAEFYVGRQLPAKLKQQLDANEAATSAQREAIQTQEAELVRINKIYDAELERLRRLWAGAPLGSSAPGPSPVAAGANPAHAR